MTISNIKTSVKRKMLIDCGAHGLLAQFRLLRNIFLPFSQFIPVFKSLLLEIQ
jgi:hypothetical protein